MLYRPLFWTSYWCEDWLFSSAYRGASRILISSASSKTAFCLAYLLRKRIILGEVNPNIKVVGLTSKKNLGFTTRLGHYHEVLEYGTFTSGSTLQGGQGKGWIYVDVAGNESLNTRVLAHFASPYTGNLVACVSLGLTNVMPASSEASSLDWTTNSVSTQASRHASPPTEDAVPSPTFWPKFEQFFTVEWLGVRKRQLSIADISSRQDQAWKELMKDCVAWVKLDHVRGANSVKRAYEKVAKDGLGPDRGLIWSLWGEPAKVNYKL